MVGWSVCGSWSVILDSSHQSETRRQQGGNQGRRTQRLSRSDLLPLARPCFLKVPWPPQTGEFMTRSYGGHCRLEGWHLGTRAVMWLCHRKSLRREALFRACKKLLLRLLWASASGCPRLPCFPPREPGYHSLSDPPKKNPFKRFT